MPDMRDDNFTDRDLLLGAKPIADFVNTLLDEGNQITPQILYGWVERNHLPVKRIGSRLVGSKTAIRRYLGA
jgi:hypothetical protein